MEGLDQAVSTNPTTPTGGDDPVVVLVVDDNVTNRVLCRGALKGTGFLVCEAADGCLALAEVERRRPDVILMDVMMPNMDGLECTRRLKASDATKDIPIIIVSARTDAEDIVQGLEAGADEYLGKPIRVAELKVRLQGVLRFYRNQKEIIRAREAIAASRALEDELAERRRMEAALRDAKDAAEAANQAKSEFLATMSHELRTPLNGVIGMTELLLRTDLNEQQRRYASVAKHSGDTLLCLINDILDFSKIEAGKIELEVVEFDLQDAITCTVSTFEERARAKKLTLAGAIHPCASLRVVGDPGRLQQILMNLTNNALKFTDQGRITLRAVIEEESHSDVTVRFTVDDTGVGIPAAGLERLFRSFSQADASTTRRYGGTGLGLAICKKLVEMMGGTIGVSTEPGLGSTFWFTVRFQRAVGQSDRRTPKQQDLRQLRILSAGGNSVDQEILFGQLDDCGIRIDTYTDGKVALAAMRNAAQEGIPYGLAILETHLSGLSGLELARTIKDDAALRDTVLILMSSAATSGDVDELRNDGFSAVLDRPASASHLLDIIAGALACAISMPARREDQGDAFETQPDGQRGTSSDTRDFRILLVDDNEIGREVACAMLAQFGYSCDTARDGAEAVSAAARNAYDLIFMDCQMPVMDGFDATRAIRLNEESVAPTGNEPTSITDDPPPVDPATARHARTRLLGGRQPPPVAIIALTANAMKGDRERCLAAGMDDYLTKPLQAEQLMATIARHASNRQATTGQPCSVAENDADGKHSRAQDLVDVKTSDSPPRIVPSDALDQAEPFDVDAIRKRWGCDPAFAVKLIRMFQGQAPDLINKIRSALEAGDHEGMGQFAHGLKGAAAYVAAEAVRKLAEELEHMGRDGDLRTAPVRLEWLERETQQCLAFIVEPSVATAATA